MRMVVAARDDRVQRGPGGEQSADEPVDPVTLVTQPLERAGAGRSGRLITDARAELGDRGRGRRDIGAQRRLHRSHDRTVPAEVKRRQARATHPAEYVALQYTWGMVSGKAKLDPLDNDRYPAVRPTRVAEFARRLTI